MTKEKACEKLFNFLKTNIFFVSLKCMYLDFEKPICYHAHGKKKCSFKNCPLIDKSEVFYESKIGNGG